MRAEHLAIDGSVVSFEADADLTTQATATGWAIVPSLMRAHPFSILPAGHSAVVEETVRSYFPDFELLSLDEYSLKGGNLRVAQVRMPTATDSTRELSIGAWEGRSGCMTTSLRGRDSNMLVEVFDSLKFRERSRGLAIDSPVTPRPREPMILKEIPEFGVLEVRPAIPSTLERIPRARGRITNNGELFRVRATSTAMMLVTSSAVVRINPIKRGGDAEAEMAAASEMLAVAQDLRVEWTPRR